MTDEASHRLTRRAFLSVLAAAGTAACTGGVQIDPATVPGERSSGRGPRGVGASEGPTARPERKPKPFEPIPGDTYPNAKRVAGRFVEQLMTYEAGADLRAVVRGAAKKTHPDFDLAGVVERAKPLHLPDATSRGQVVYPQLAGLYLGSGTDRAAVMVVARQDVSGGDSGEGFSVTRTLDVRLAIRNGEWAIEDLASAGGTMVGEPAPDLPDVAVRVLEDTRIELPDSARWDILRGDIDEQMLTTMLDLAAVAPYAATVLASGHPRNVFATDRVSTHTLGRAVDIWQIAGRPVVLQQGKRSEARALTEAALKDSDVPELGSPWDLDGPPVPGKVKPSFTDAVHIDHIHVAVKAS